MRTLKLQTYRETDRDPEIKIRGFSLHLFGAFFLEEVETKVFIEEHEHSLESGLEEDFIRDLKG